jgi:hypothetical protein
MTDCRIGAVGFYLAPDLIPSRVRLSPWTRQCEDRDSEKFAYHGGEEGALTQSMLDRVSDLLRSRRCIALEQIKPQNNATVDSCLYHLRAAVGSASALFDSLAVLAHLAFKIPVPENSGDMAISLRRREFRKPLREAGGSRLAATASQTAPLLHLIWSLRTPVLHRERLFGVRPRRPHSWPGGSGLACRSQRLPSGSLGGVLLAAADRSGGLGLRASIRLDCECRFLPLR